ncbi:unnamed protein product [Rhizophagus irregularis]|nr:unnamed protein product [Rhizophagus irregularis]
MITFSSSFSDWKNMDDFWTMKFLKEAKNLGLDLKEKVHIFYFARCPNFVVGKGKIKAFRKMGENIYTGKEFLKNIKSQLAYLVVINTSSPASTSEVTSNTSGPAFISKIRRQFIQSAGNDKVIQFTQDKAVQSTPYTNDEKIIHNNENKNEQEIDNLTNFYLP